MESLASHHAKSPQEEPCNERHDSRIEQGLCTHEVIQFEGHAGQGTSQSENQERQRGFGRGHLTKMKKKRDLKTCIRKDRRASIRTT